MIHVHLFYPVVFGCDNHVGFLNVPRGCLRFVIVVFPDHTHLLFWSPCLTCILVDVHCCAWEACEFKLFGIRVYILCTISLAINYVSHLYVLTFVQYRTILITMTRTGS